MKLRKGFWLSAIFVFLFFTVFSVTPAGASNLIILHTNDIHGRIEMNDDLMGMPIITSIIQDYRDNYDNVLVLDAGDTIHGRPITNSLEGRSTVEAMNMAGYDVMVPGNHDFNFGYERLLELEEKMDFDLVATNVLKDGELLFRPYVVREFADFSVGIFGLATPATYSTTHPDNIVGIEFSDMVEAARKYVDILRDEYQVDLVIALGHVGFGGDNPSTRVAQEVEGIDLFVDGHSHSRLPEGEWHHGTLFVQAYEYTKYLGKVEIDLSGDEPVMSALLISAEEAYAQYEPSSEMVELLDKAREEVRQKLLGF